MKELNSVEKQQVNGGILVVPLLVIAAKGFGAGLAAGTAAYGLYFAARNST